MFGDSLHQPEEAVSQEEAEVASDVGDEIVRVVDQVLLVDVVAAGAENKADFQLLM